MIIFPSKREIGNWGEQKAAAYVSQRGYQIITVNYRCYYGEIDLVTMDGEIWCFIEVKTRRGTSYGYGYQAITPTKQRHLIDSAQFFLQERSLFDVPIRFDVVSIDFHSVTQYQIHLIKNAF